MTQIEELSSFQLDLLYELVMAYALDDTLLHGQILPDPVLDWGHPERLRMLLDGAQTMDKLVRLGLLEDVTKEMQEAFLGGRDTGGRNIKLYRPTKVASMMFRTIASNGAPN